MLAEKVEGIREAADRSAFIDHIDKAAQHDEHPDRNDDGLHPVSGDQIAVHCPAEQTGEQTDDYTEPDVDAAFKGNSH
ncbi:hypothetical protein D3C73_1517860 [compost metagenome]